MFLNPNLSGGDDDLVRDAHPTGQHSTQANLSLYHPFAATAMQRSR